VTKKETQKVEEIIVCPECKSTHISRDYTRAEMVCEGCGLVIDDGLIDQGPEWRAFDREQQGKRERTGVPMTYTIHDKGLSTVVGWGNRDSYGNYIPTKSRAQIYRLRKWQRRTRISSTVEKNLANALSNLNRMSSSMGLPRTVRETAAMLYRKAALKKLTRGRTIEGTVAAALYAACRQCGVPRTLEEIANVAGLSRKEVGRNHRFLARRLGLKMAPPAPQDYIPRFCNKLGLSGDVQTKTLGILKEATGQELTSGRGPLGIAAASLYIASVLCGERKTQREVADVAGVTEVTIRNRYKEMVKKLDIEITL